jgi:hypothetical protein
MKEQNQSEQPDTYQRENKAAHDQVAIAQCQAYVKPSLVGRISLDEPRAIDLLNAFDPGSLNKKWYSASEPGKIVVVLTIPEAMIGQNKNQGDQTENRYNHERQNYLLFSISPV